MANYSLMINSKFKPFSYAELLQPAVRATEAHQNVEEKYSELSAKANVWEGLANQESDPVAYNKYKQYVTELKKESDNLAAQGLTPGGRKNMLKMAERYSSDIVPIEQAYAKKQALAEEQRKALLQNPTLMFQRNFNYAGQDTSLDRFLENPNYSYGDQYSGDLITKQVAQMATNLSKELRGTKVGALDSYTNTFLQKYGLNSSEVLRAINNPEDPQSSKALQAIYSSALETVPEAIKSQYANELRGYANQGLWSAVGQDKISTFENYGNKLAAQQYAQRGGKEEDTNPNNLYYRAVPSTTVKQNTDNKQKEDYLKIIQEVINDPSLLSKKEKRIVRDPKMFSPDPMISMAMDTGMGEEREEVYNYHQEKLKEISKKYNLKYDIKDGQLIGGNLKDIAKTIEGDIASSAVRSFTYKPNITQSDLISQVLKENARTFHNNTGNIGLNEFEDGTKGGTVKIGDLNKYFTADTDIEFNPNYGFVINATDKDNKTRSAVLDIELFDDPQRTFSRAMNSIQTALKYNEAETATLLIDNLMQALYFRFNTLAQKQSNTSSKI